MSGGRPEKGEAVVQARDDDVPGAGDGRRGGGEVPVADLGNWTEFGQQEEECGQDDFM